MDTLNDSTWDIVLCGTGLPQSLLALALSRSGKKILHLDKNDYYGGSEAALSLEDAKKWCHSIQGIDGAPFRDATIEQASDEASTGGKLSYSRAYSLSLSPQLIYNRSNLLPALVSSKVYQQLEFLAVGNWWIYDSIRTPTERSTDGGAQNTNNGGFRKIPSSREDVVNDTSIDLRSKRSVMRFLQLAADADQCEPTILESGSMLFRDFLSSRFKIPERLQAPFHALTLSPDPPSKTTTAFALHATHRHLTSIGLFGPGFGAVIPKWGGLAEIAQVGCRACAVGGAVYVLDKHIECVQRTNKEDEAGKDEPTLSVQLSDGEKITAGRVVGSRSDAFTSEGGAVETGLAVSRSIDVVASSLDHLFPQGAEGAAPAAVAVVIFPSGSLGVAANTPTEETPPVHLMVHSSDSGECPIGQSVVYGQTIVTPTSFSLLKAAVSRLLESSLEQPTPKILWSMQYTHTLSQSSNGSTEQGPIVSDVLPSLVLEDDVVRDVHRAWEVLVGEERGDGFMTFKQREESGADDEAA